MEVSFGVFCDYAFKTEDRKLSAVGIFDTIGVVGSFPAAHICWFAASFSASASEAKDPEPVYVLWLDEDGNELYRSPASKLAFAPPAAKGLRARFYLRIYFPDLPLKGQGLHELKVMTESGAELLSTSLRVFVPT